jgi:hypothetical protein
MLIRIVFAAAALPAVVRAAARASRLFPAQPIEEVVESLRAVPAFRFGALDRPIWLAALVERLLPVLPVPRGGRCLRRSLLLLDLWARCGLDPELRLDWRGENGEPAGHAWVVARRPAADGSRPSSQDLGREAAFRF